MNTDFLPIPDPRSRGQKGTGSRNPGDIRQSPFCQKRVFPILIIKCVCYNVLINASFCILQPISSHRGFGIRRGFDRSCRYNRLVQYGRDAAIKAEWPEPSNHLRSTCTRGNTIYENLNESSSARLGGSQQLEILPSPNSKRAQNFSA
jgi:hypothetical protein